MNNNDALRETAVETALAISSQFQHVAPEYILGLLDNYGVFNALSASKPVPHSDDDAVDRFAVAMKEKLAQARKKGRGGWQECDPGDLSRMLRDHVEKGDPRDVANFCMFLWHHGVGISKPEPQAPPHEWRCVAPPCKCDETNYKQCCYAAFGHPPQYLHEPQAQAGESEYHCIGYIDGYGHEIKDKSESMKVPRAVYVRVGSMK